MMRYFPELIDVVVFPKQGVEAYEYFLVSDDFKVCSYVQ